MTYKDKGSYESSPPCNSPAHNTHIWCGYRYQIRRWECAVILVLEKRNLWITHPHVPRMFDLAPQYIINTDFIYVWMPYNQHRFYVCTNAKFNYEGAQSFLRWNPKKNGLTHSERHTRFMQVKISNWTMGWLELVGSIKLQVSFAEYRLFYRALLQKRPIILSIPLTVATPYDGAHWYMC